MCKAAKAEPDSFVGWIFLEKQMENPSEKKMPLNRGNFLEINPLVSNLSGK